VTETKEFKFYDNCYYCDRDGNIYNKSHKRLSTRVSKSRDGYLTVTLWGKDETGRKRYTAISVHTIVASLFVPKPNTHEILEVNHKDCDRTNPKADNLEWVTHENNVKYSVRLGRHVSPNWSGTNNPKSKLDEKEVQEIIELYNSGLRIRDIKRTNKFNVSESRIGQIISSYKKTQTTTSVSGG
jgi:hypothetical protein